MSNNLIILKNPIKVYNNLLKTASTNILFGVNQINYEGTVNTPKKVHQETPSYHLETLDNKQQVEKAILNIQSNNHNNELAIILGISVIVSYYFSKYML